MGHLGRFALIVGAAALFAGCGGPQAPMGAPDAMPQSYAMAQTGSHHGSFGFIDKAATKGDLLYAAGPGSFVAILTYPKGHRVGKLSPLNVIGGICSDTRGNVFIPVAESASASIIYEFAHGGTTPIASLSDPGIATACSYDQVTGNLAIANDGPTVAIFAGAQGTPTIYQTSSVPAYFCAYDNEGNLFVDEVHTSSELAELPAGGSEFTKISLDYSFSPGSLQWVTDHLVVAAYTWSSKGPQPIYNVSIAGSEGDVSGPILLSSKNGRHPVGVLVQFDVQGNKIIGPMPQGPFTNFLDFWNYPDGGSPIKHLLVRGGSWNGVTISVASSR